MNNAFGWAMTWLRILWTRRGTADVRDLRERADQDKEYELVGNGLRQLFHVLRTCDPDHLSLFEATQGLNLLGEEVSRLSSYTDLASCVAKLWCVAAMEVMRAGAASRRAAEAEQVAQDEQRIYETAAKRMVVIA